MPYAFLLFGFWESELRSHVCGSGALPIEPHPQPFSLILMEPVLKGSTVSVDKGIQVLISFLQRSWESCIYSESLFSPLSFVDPHSTNLLIMLFR